MREIWILLEFYQAEERVGRQKCRRQRRPRRLNQMRFDEDRLLRNNIDWGTGDEVPCGRYGE